MRKTKNRMIKFSIPYNSDLKVTKESIKRYKPRIEEVYFAIDPDIATSSKGAMRRISADEAKKLIGTLKKSGIKSNILINGIYQGNRDPGRIKGFIQSIGGVDGITVADLYLLEVFKGFGPKLHISRIAQLNSVEKIRRILARYPDLTINVDNDLNRDLAALRKIYSLKKYFPNFRLKLMVNEGCLFHCTGRTRHTWLLCLSKQEKKYAGGPFSCPYHVSPDEVDKEMIKSPFIRPEDLSFYEKNRAVDIFKIAGRYTPGKSLLTVIDAYMKGRHKGSLVELIMNIGIMRSFSRRYLFDVDNTKFPKDFVKKVTACDKFCAGCDYCVDVARKVMVAPRGIKEIIKKNQNP